MTYNERMVKEDNKTVAWGNLIDWIYEGLIREDWSLRRLGREAGISHSLISMVLSGQQQPTTDFCIAVAKAFRTSPMIALTKAGIIPPMDDDDVTFRELWHHVRKLRRRDRYRLLRIAREWADEPVEEEEEEE